MLESTEQISLTLSLAGETLNFPDIVTYDELLVPTIVREALALNAIPGATIYNIQGYDAQGFDIQGKDIVFRCSVADYISKAIKIEDTFTYCPSNTPTRTFTFKIMNAIDDMTGWMQLDSALIGTTDV